MIVQPPWLQPARKTRFWSAQPWVSSQASMAKTSAERFSPPSATPVQTNSLASRVDRPRGFSESTTTAAQPDCTAARA
jgi:hypothetical protein